MNAEPSSSTRFDLVERAEFLGELDNVFNAARQAGGQLLLIGGEAGVGKTSLIRSFCSGNDSIEVKWGACERLFTPRIFGPFLDIALQMGDDADRLFDSGVQAVDFVRFLLRGLEGGEPRILVIEDLQWADEGTLDVLKLFVGRLATARVLLIASFRDDELSADNSLRLVLGEISTAVGVHRFQVPPLTREAVLILAAASELDGEQLYDRTGGNPFFVTEVLASGKDFASANVRDAVMARVARIGPQGRHLLEAAAVVPSRIETSLLQAIAPKEIGHLGECIGAGMLRAEGAYLTFRHEIARMAVEESISPHHRIDLHQRILAVLEERPSVDPARLAHHADAAGDVRRVLKYASAAGAHAASLGAHFQAAEHFERALRYSGSLSLEQEAVLYERLALARHLALEDPGPAVTAARAALKLRRALGEKLPHGKALQWLARLLWYAGRPQEAEAAARGAVNLIETVQDDEALAMAYADLERILMHVYKSDEALLWASKAIDLAERVGAEEALASALDSLGVLQLREGNAKGWANLERSVHLAESSGSASEMSRALVSLSLAAVDARRYKEAEQHIQTALNYISDSDVWPARRMLLAVRARYNLERGRWREAAEDARQALQHKQAMPASRVLGLVVLARIRARRGEAGTWDLLDEARKSAIAEDVVQLALVAAARAEMALLENDPARVGPETDKAYALVCKKKLTRQAGELAYWRWKAGLMDESPPVIENPYANQIAGNSAAAAVGWRDLGCPYEAAIAMSESGEEAQLRDALSEFRRLGAVPAERATALALRQRGFQGLKRGPSQSTVQNQHALTYRQTEVLALLSKRLTNLEIADRLYISAKTVDHHVSAILAKLGVDNRKQAADKAIELGLGIPFP